jgi:excisionase family DNA binding protein
MTTLLSTKQVAEVLCVCVATVRRKIQSGELKAHKLGHRTLRVRKSDLDDFVRDRRSA